jgi:hypothetical protein
MTTRLALPPSTAEEFAAHLALVTAADEARHEIDRAAEDVAAHYELMAEFSIKVLPGGSCLWQRMTGSLLSRAYCVRPCAAQERSWHAHCRPWRTSR